MQWNIKKTLLKNFLFICFFLYYELSYENIEIPKSLSIIDLLDDAPFQLIFNEEELKIIHTAQPISMEITSFKEDITDIKIAFTPSFFKIINKYKYWYIQLHLEYLKQYSTDINIYIYKFIQPIKVIPPLKTQLELYKKNINEFYTKNLIAFNNELICNMEKIDNINSSIILTIDKDNWIIDHNEGYQYNMEKCSNGLKIALLSNEAIINKLLEEDFASFMKNSLLFSQLINIINQLKDNLKILITEQWNDYTRTIATIFNEKLLQYTTNMDILDKKETEKARNFIDNLFDEISNMINLIKNKQDEIEEYKTNFNIYLPLLKEQLQKSTEIFSNFTLSDINGLINQLDDKSINEFDHENISFVVDQSSLHLSNIHKDLQVNLSQYELIWNNLIKIIDLINDQISKINQIQETIITIEDKSVINFDYQKTNHQWQLDTIKQSIERLKIYQDKSKIFREFYNDIWTSPVQDDLDDYYINTENSRKNTHDHHIKQEETTIFNDKGEFNDDNSEENKPILSSLPLFYHKVEQEFQKYLYQKLNNGLDNKNSVFNKIIKFFLDKIFVEEIYEDEFDLNNTEKNMIDQTTLLIMKLIQEEFYTNSHISNNDDNNYLKFLIIWMNCDHNPMVREKYQTFIQLINGSLPLDSNYDPIELVYFNSLLDQWNKQLNKDYLINDQESSYDKDEKIFIDPSLFDPHEPLRYIYYLLYLDCNMEEKIKNLNIKMLTIKRFLKKSIDHKQLFLQGFIGHKEYTPNKLEIIIQRQFLYNIPIIKDKTHVFSIDHIREKFHMLQSQNKTFQHQLIEKIDEQWENYQKDINDYFKEFVQTEFDNKVITLNNRLVDVESIYIINFLQYLYEYKKKLHEHFTIFFTMEKEIDLIIQPIEEKILDNIYNKYPQLKQFFQDKNFDIIHQIIIAYYYDCLNIDQQKTILLIPNINYKNMMSCIINMLLNPKEDLCPLMIDWCCNNNMYILFLIKFPNNNNILDILLDLYKSPEAMNNFKKKFFFLLNDKIIQLNKEITQLNTQNSHIKQSYTNPLKISKSFFTLNQPYTFYDISHPYYHPCTILPDNTKVSTFKRKLLDLTKNIYEKINYESINIYLFTEQQIFIIVDPLIINLIIKDRNFNQYMESLIIKLPSNANSFYPINNLLKQEYVYLIKSQIQNHLSWKNQSSELITTLLQEDEEESNNSGKCLSGSYDENNYYNNEEKYSLGNQSLLIYNEDEVLPLKDNQQWNEPEYRSYDGSDDYNNRSNHDILLDGSLLYNPIEPLDYESLSKTPKHIIKQKIKSPINYTTSKSLNSSTINQTIQFNINDSKFNDDEDLTQQLSNPSRSNSLRLSSITPKHIIKQKTKLFIKYTTPKSLNHKQQYKQQSFIHSQQSIYDDEDTIIKLKQQLSNESRSNSLRLSSYSNPYRRKDLIMNEEYPFKNSNNINKKYINYQTTKSLNSSIIHKKQPFIHIHKSIYDSENRITQEISLKHHLTQQLSNESRSNSLRLSFSSNPHRIKKKQLLRINKNNRSKSIPMKKYLVSINKRQRPYKKRLIYPSKATHNILSNRAIIVKPKDPMAKKKIIHNKNIHNYPLINYNNYYILINLKIIKINDKILLEKAIENIIIEFFNYLRPKTICLLKFIIKIIYKIFRKYSKYIDILLYKII